MAPGPYDKDNSGWMIVAR